MIHSDNKQEYYFFINKTFIYSKKKHRVLCYANYIENNRATKKKTRTRNSMNYKKK